MRRTKALFRFKLIRTLSSRSYADDFDFDNLHRTVFTEAFHPMAENPPGIFTIPLGPEETSQTEDPSIPAPKRKAPARIPETDRVPASSSDDNSEPIDLMDTDEHKSVQVPAVDLEGRSKVLRVSAGYTGINILRDLGLPEFSSICSRACQEKVSY